MQKRMVLVELETICTGYRDFDPVLYTKKLKYSAIRIMVPRRETRDQLKIEPITRLNHYQK